MNIYGRVGWRAAASVNPAPGVDADALAFITAASITDNTQKSAINTLVTQLKTYGIWTKLKAVYPFVGGNASAHKFNLKDPRDLDAAYRLVFNGGWVHSSTGVLPNGSNAFAETRFNPTSLTSSSAHLSYYSRTSTGFAGYEIGSIQTSNTTQLALITRYSDDKQYAFAGNYNALPSTTNTDGRGFYITNRNSSTNTTGFKNITKTIDTTQTGGLPNVNLCIGAYFMNGSNIGGYGNKESAFASIGDGLTDTEASNFYTAVQAYQTTLGRAV